jgi:hypothetical protein
MRDRRDDFARLVPIPAYTSHPEKNPAYRSDYITLMSSRGVEEQLYWVSSLSVHNMRESGG